MADLTVNNENINGSRAIFKSQGQLILINNRETKPQTATDEKAEINLEEDQYLMAVRKVIDDGFEVMDRTGIGIRSIFGMQMRYNLRNSAQILITRIVSLFIIHKNSLPECFRKFLYTRTSAFYILSKSKAFILLNCDKRILFCAFAYSNAKPLLNPRVRGVAPLSHS